MFLHWCLDNWVWGDYRTRCWFLCLSLVGKNLIPWFPFLLWIFQGCIGWRLPVSLTCSSFVFKVECLLVLRTGGKEMRARWSVRSEGGMERKERKLLTVPVTVLGRTLRIRSGLIEKIRRSLSSLPGLLAGVTCAWAGVSAQVGDQNSYLLLLRIYFWQD